MTLSDNARGGLLMTFSMAVFAIADACIKASSSYIDQGLILLCLGLGSTVIFAALAIGRGVPIFSRTLLAWPVVGRCGVEIVATGAIVMAVSRADLSTASARPPPLSPQLRHAPLYYDSKQIHFQNHSERSLTQWVVRTLTLESALPNSDPRRRPLRSTSRRAISATQRGRVCRKAPTPTVPDGKSE